MSSWRASTSRATVSPLMLMLSSMSGLLLEGSRRGSTERALGQHGGQVALVVDRSPAVADRRAVLCGHPARLGEELLARGVAAKRGRCPFGARRRRAQRAQADAGFDDLAAVDPQC